MTDTPRRWLLLHGTPLNPAVWQATADHLTDQPVETPDLTAVPDTPDPQRALARSIANTFAGELDVVAHSFGGQIAIELALAAPDRVRTLTIMCSRDTPYPAFEVVASGITHGNIPGVEATLERWFSVHELNQNADIVEVARRCLLTASMPDWGRALSAIACYDSSAEAPSLTMPVTLVAAGNDAVSTPEVMNGMASRMPDSRLQVRDGWHHMSPFADPDELARLLIAARARG